MAVKLNSEKSRSVSMICVGLTYLLAAVCNTQVVTN